MESIEQTPGGGIEPEAQTFGMLVHISSLAGWLTGIGFLLGPLIVWLIKKDQHPFVDAHGKESLNFQITMFIAQLVLIVPAVLTCGITSILNLILLVVQSVFAIMAGVAANKGEQYRYPLTWRVIK